MRPAHLSQEKIFVCEGYPHTHTAERHCPSAHILLNSLWTSRLSCHAEECCDEESGVGLGARTPMLEVDHSASESLGGRVTDPLLR